ncbi:MAG: ribosome recycling factor [Patescibacteria group bacterium]
MLENLHHDLAKAEEHLHNEFNKLQVGRANPAIVEGITVLAYGSLGPLRNVASIGVLDAQTLSIQPYDRSLIKDIDRAITDANLGLNPQNNGETILIRIPTLTEERRRDLAKIAKKLADEGKVAVRNIRADYLKKIKAQGDDVSEDMVAQQEKDLQKAVDAESKKIDELLAKKETDIMKV